MVGRLKIILVGCGQMGSSHGRAYRDLDGFEVVGLVSRGSLTRGRLSAELGGVPTFPDIGQAIKKTKPDAVSINTYPDSHAEYCRTALANNLHVFVEKPIATTVADAEAIAADAAAHNKKVVVGYILRFHPSWERFIHLARGLGKPLVMRMNLNQQSSGKGWELHKNLMKSVSPIVDCGVHYVDVMCQMTRSKPVLVHAIGARLTEEIEKNMYNYGMLQVKFADDSVGWYESGWGPMVSETAHFVKDVFGPKGSVSIGEQQAGVASTDIDSHTRTENLVLHMVSAAGNTVERMGNEPDHQELCRREQEFFYRSIEEDIDPSEHLQNAIDSLRIVLAADESIHKGKTISL